MEYLLLFMLAVPVIAWCFYTYSRLVTQDELRMYEVFKVTKEEQGVARYISISGGLVSLAAASREVDRLNSENTDKNTYYTSIRRII